MERAAYRLFYDNIHDFKTAAMNVESEIIRHGIRSGSNDSVPGMNGRTHHDMWVSMKTVSHFNLGTALESMLKLLAFLNKIAIPQHHFLTNLHDAIPAKCQKQLESTYQASKSVLPDGWKLIAFLKIRHRPHLLQRPGNPDEAEGSGAYESPLRKFVTVGSATSYARGTATRRGTEAPSTEEVDLEGFERRLKRRAPREPGLPRADHVATQAHRSGAGSQLRLPARCAQLR